MIKRLPVHGLDPAGGTDGQVPVISGGKFVVGDAPAPGPGGGGTGSASSALVPLTTVVGGVPTLVWDEDNQLVMTEVSL